HHQGDHTFIFITKELLKIEAVQSNFCLARTKRKLFRGCPEIDSSSILCPFRCGTLFAKAMNR
ncbi:MAG TPA: hypothetical protein VH815_11895, partial [Acidobacteriota bacterium]